MTDVQEYFRIAGIAAAALGVPFSSVERIERIKGGLTNASWRAVCAAGDVVVRISTADEAALQIDRVSESRVLELIERAGIGPVVLRCDPKDRILVTRYIPGTPWTQQDAVAPENILRLARLLGQLHSLEVKTDVAVTDLGAILRHYWATLADRELPDPAGPWNREEMLHIAGQLTEGVGRHPARCLCHNDIQPLNVLDTGRLWLIDWEYAGIGSPWFDLASACCNHDYDESQRHHLLRHYLGHDDPHAVAQLQLACQLFDYIRELWLTVRGA